MQRFPAFINVRSRNVIVAGGGEEALRKASLLLDAGAVVTVIAPQVDAQIIELVAKRDGHIVQRAPEQSDFKAAVLVFVADYNEDESQKVAEAASAAGALVNVVDQPALCDFTTPSIIDRGDVVVAISTNGTAPVLGQFIRARIEAMLPVGIGRLAAFANAFRSSVKSAIAKEQRRFFWRRVFEGDIAALFLSGNEKAAREAMIETINRPSMQMGEREGVVHIVGAGPGDPELLTLKAHRLLQEADVIVHDRLVSADVLNIARRDARRIYVGKQKANHTLGQNEISDLLVEEARKGNFVVRLKGGDPFVFGRGGEEIDVLRAAGVATFITPGITAATGCAANVGMALTHRDFSQAVTFVTGHGKADQKPDLNWSALVELGHTLVIYMGVTRAPEIVSALLRVGQGSTTPVAIIENGTCPDQRLFKGVLGDLASLLEEHDVTGPALLVVGDVATLADDALCSVALSHEMNERRQFA